METDEFIAATMQRVAASATPPEGMEPAPAAPRRWWSSPAAVVGAAAAVLLVVGVGVVLGTQRSTDESPATSSADCRLDYTPEPLPSWARSGFTPPDQPIAHVLGDEGDIVAVVWGEHHPLVSPPAPGRSNKILWVVRTGDGEGPLEIRATLAGTDRTVTRTVAPAPGPSGIDLPAAGCWSLDLTWGEHHDHLVLGYAAG